MNRNLDEDPEKYFSGLNQVLQHSRYTFSDPSPASIAHAFIHFIHAVHFFVVLCQKVLTL